MTRETGVQSQRFKKWYLMPPCLTLSIIKCGSRVKLGNTAKGVAPSPTSRCSSYRKGNRFLIISPASFLHLRYLMVFFWSLSDSMSPQVSKILLGILANLCDAVVWMVSVRPPISNSSSLFTKLLGIVPSAPITTRITINYIFQSFFSCLPKSKNLSLFSFFFLNFSSVVPQDGKASSLFFSFSLSAFFL